MTQDKTKKKSARSLIKKLGLIIIGLFLLYVIAGFWVVPPLLKPRLEKELSSQIGRKVTIEEIKTKSPVPVGYHNQSDRLRKRWRAICRI